MKRFTDTEKWFDPWFRQLPPAYKLFWIFLCDRCDNAGVYKPDIELAAMLIGEKITRADILKKFGDRITVMPNEDWWVEKFIGFQCGKLSQDCIPHRQVLRLLDHHQLSYHNGSLPRNKK